MQINKVLLTALLCLFNIFLFAQKPGHITISGYIRDPFGRAIAGASVIIDGSTRGTVTDDEGFYKLEKSAPGKLLLKISMLGYVAQEKWITIGDNANVTHDFKLKEDRGKLSEIVVYGKTVNQTKVEDIKRSGFNVNVIDLNKHSNEAANINQVIRRTTGITVRESGGMGSDFVFRINGLDAKIYIDGIPMDNFGSSMTLNNIPVNLVDRVEIYKGVVPAFLGSDALGGAVNIITKRRNRRFIDLSYSYGSFNTHQASLVSTFAHPKNGLSVKVNGFYNLSDNNYTMYTEEKYNVILETTENNRYIPIEKARRFYDRYESAMGQVEVGAQNRKWADRFFAGLTYSQNKKENQLGATVNTVRGGNWSESNYIMPTLTYVKNNFLIKGLYADVFASYSNEIRHVRDTALHNYDWSGKWISNTLNSEPNEPVHMRYNNNNYLARTNFNYDFNEERTQSLNLNYNFNTSRQRSYDLVENRDVNGLPNRLGRHIAGLSWQGQWLKKRLISMLSVKYYGMDTYKQVDERVFGNNNTVVSGEIKSYNNFWNYYSGNLALRYRFAKDAGVKFSLERAYNMPGMTAIFGDGQNYLANWDIQPERSDNLNVGGYYNTFIKVNHFLNLDASVFYRRAANFINTRIVTQSDGSLFQFYNVPGVNLYGFEAEIKYGYKDLIALTLNGSYDKAVDNQKYTDDTNQQVSLTYKSQLPNRPWVYGNTDLTLAKNDWLGKGSRIQLSWLYQYTHWFYLSWAHLGTLASKDHIPSQMVQSVIISYSWKRNKYNISGEARNLTNERVYDNFRLQKPGRAFYLKLRVSIM
ncbi:MAG: TonB-dependent receptor [Chitinophagaceae bacterium]|nr:TonB-dependent receptor [Chitinophagaceae bacterium]